MPRGNSTKLLATLADKAWDRWLVTTETVAGELTDPLGPFDPIALEAWSISTQVNALVEK